jgi:sterol desaturase/sphingolipid hydroxylase (fatty acid hydroxylase superfamily)
MDVRLILEHFFVLIVYLVVYCCLKIVEFSFGLESILQGVWDHLFTIFGDDRVFYNVWIFNILTISLVWGINGSFAFVERVIKPRFLDNYKIPIKPSEHRGEINVFKVSMVALRNQIFSICIALFASLEVRNQIIKVPRELPSFSIVIRDFAVFIICEEILYYWVHRLFHHRWLYGFVHKLHHEYNTSLGLTAHYCTLTEHFFNKNIPPTIGFVIMKSHPFTVMVWLAAIIVTTFNRHYGYTFVGHPAEFHEYHHIR